MTTAEDRKQILSKYRCGAKKAHLAKAYGLSATRISAIIASEHRKELEMANPPPLHGLTVRAKNTLLGAGLETRQEILQAYRANKLKDVLNLGAKSAEEIRVWLNEPLPTKPVRDPCTCPDFQRATEGGTADDGCSQAIDNDNEGHWYIGRLIDKPLKFCPYCGKPLQPPKN